MGLINQKAENDKDKYDLHFTGVDDNSCCDNNLVDLVDILLEIQPNDHNPTDNERSIQGNNSYRILL